MGRSQLCISSQHTINKLLTTGVCLQIHSTILLPATPSAQCKHIACFVISCNNCVCLNVHIGSDAGCQKKKGQRQSARTKHVQVDRHACEQAEPMKTAEVSMYIIRPATPSTVIH